MSVLDRMSALDWIVVISVWLIPAVLWLFKAWIDRGRDKLARELGETDL